MEARWIQLVLQDLVLLLMLKTLTSLLILCQLVQFLKQADTVHAIDKKCMVDHSSNLVKLRHVSSSAF